ncbi:hypothetical protein RA307_04870 [Xanthobacteraceae bacterium Astr-EGSB]|uniref:hypothetical protein n=1 Tax=Astrobacterium formosum TaxID=3069710 RepID=UPI0027B507EE|nr:hypothetical protein [Xanthobacteraceae bacterium Astr-EGSB]
MNATVDIATASRFVATIEDVEARRLGVNTIEARRAVASRCGIAPGTLENLRRERAKVVPHWIMARVRAAFIAILQSEIQRLEHDITIARQVGLDDRDDDLAAAAAQLVAAKTLIAHSVR